MIDLMLPLSFLARRIKEDERRDKLLKELFSVDSLMDEVKAEDISTLKQVEGIHELARLRGQLKT